MIDTTFVDGTVITADWLNGVNDIAVDVEGLPAELASSANASVGAGLVAFNSANSYAAGTVGANLKTLTSPTIVTPAISGGTWSGATLSSPALTTPTITTPAVTNGTYSAGTFTSPIIITPAVTGGTYSSPALTTPTLTTPTSTNGTLTTPSIVTPTISNPTVSGTPVISSTAVTWSGNPTHSGNHTFSGAVVFSGTVAVVPTKVGWTPALKFGGASTGMTYTTQSAYYIQVGEFVLFNLEIVLSAKGSSTGSATISGFPFNSALRSVFAMYTHHVAGSGVALAPFADMVAGTSSIVLCSYVDAIGGITATYNETAFMNDTQISISGWVFV